MYKHKTFSILAALGLTVLFFGLFILAQRLWPWEEGGHAADTEHTVDTAAAVDTDDAADTAAAVDTDDAADTAAAVDTADTDDAADGATETPPSALPDESSDREEEPLPTVIGKEMDEAGERDGGTARVTEGGGATVLVALDGQVRQMPLEAFVLGALIAEMPADFHPEALRAQAVAIRTLALYKQQKYDAGSHPSAHGGAALCGSPGHCCAYDDPDGYLADHGAAAARSLPLFEEAVEATAGMIVTYRGAPIEAAFHASSHQRTASSEEVWGGALPYLVSVDTPEQGRVTVRVLGEETLSALGSVSAAALLGEQGMAVRYTESGRVSAVSVGGMAVSGERLRSLLKLPSTCFELTVQDGVPAVICYGSGHGVGMSQYGADALGENGYGWREILLHYYVGCEIEEMA